MANPYCYWDADLAGYVDAENNEFPCNWNRFPDTGSTIDATPPHNPANHTGIQINTNTGGAGGITYGQSWLDKLLNTLTSVYAINQHQPYVPTTAQPVNQTRFPQSGYPVGYQQSGYPQGYQGGNAGAQFGGSLQNFIANNTTVLLIGGAALVLLMMKPPSRRNGIMSDMQKMLGVKNPRRRERRRR